MREIKFRGKKIDNGDWLYGYYFKYEDTHNIVPDRYSSKPCGYFNVIPETVGQFTGLKDKNGNEIYEGDVIYWEDDMLPFEITQDVKGEVIYDGNGFVLREKSAPQTPYDDYLIQNDIAEIIGNIHDNANLLK